MRTGQPKTGCLSNCQKRGKCYCIVGLERIEWLKLLRITFNKDPSNKPLASFTFKFVRYKVILAF